MMMQLDQQSRWQYWMRMLARGLQTAHQPMPSTAGCTRLAVSDWHEASIDRSTSLAAGRNYPENRKDL